MTGIPSVTCGVCAATFPTKEEAVHHVVAEHGGGSILEEIHLPGTADAEEAP